MLYESTYIYIFHMAKTKFDEIDPLPTYLGFSASATTRTLL
jgi:hypothetical protein